MISLMGELMKLWMHRAFKDCMEALDHFESTGDRSKLGEWSGKYGDQIDEGIDIEVIEKRIKERYANKIA